ncbi:DUF1054 domain-containing protein [Heyndrickxia ginsengihumi]|uniref:UPF0637 protein G4D61_01755 n=1 Tax=Heyndrickxia ginsengihumi TaxID=363870 RepID=A0A6M0P215_9BACI|nr:DUF1054 domain-containing protein [Heyndrickxia ginsengihumi]MBE6183656.1 DUF1054 domain-containing protein [Bacillus sp. (in: firmicutes)]MCM3022366.1 DUF1054 domain-containing protein [Heyndrickxia ginsengihumi]NEY18692.1 DUF1054 domain-containing protein [Heyndrickxia ginsengihumi]
MNIASFTEQDFQVFNIEGLDARMEQLKQTVRPKLEALGAYFTPTLSAITGEEMFYHVAKHARRTINPPNDTWVAFSSNKRGYKKFPHFQIGLWETHLFIWVAIINECPIKDEIGKKLEKKINPIIENIPSHYVWSNDHTKPNASILNKHELQSLFRRMQVVKKAEMLCGLHIPKNQAIEMSPETLIKTIEDVFIHLLPIYKIV